MDKMNAVEKAGEVVWDIKKIVLGIASLTTVATGGYVIKQNYFSDNPPTVIEKTPQDVKGVTTESSSKPPESKYSLNNISTQVQKQLDTLKNEANNLNAAEVATSSPQIQKVIKDIQDLEQYPKNQAKEACIRICNGL